MAQLKRQTLFGDVELDRCFPENPRVIPEAVHTMVDGSRLLIVTGLRPALCPRKIGNLEMVEFLSVLDGTRTCAALLDGANETHEERRAALRYLFRIGLLEEGAPTASSSLARETQSFLAFARDMTRLSSSRDDILLRTEQRVGWISADEGMEALDFGPDLRTGRIRSIEDAADMELALYFVSAATSEDALLERLQAAGKMVLLVTERPGAIDVGPLLSGAGYAQLADYSRATGGRQSTTSRPGVMARAIAAQAALLIQTRATPSPFTNKTVRYAFAANGGISTETIPIPRHRPDDGSDGDEDTAARLRRQSRISVPPIRLAGTKMHEIHYARKNIAAAFEVPAASDRTRSRPEEPGWLTRLSDVVDVCFGYTIHLDGHVTRNCPSGGNLGSPECLMIAELPPHGPTLFRYIPLARVFEPLAGGRSVPSLADARAGRVTIVALANIEKATRKYEDFGINLVQLDAGVARAFLLRAATVCGLSVRPQPLLPPQALEYLRDRRSCCAPTWAFQVRPRTWSGLLPVWRRRLERFRQLLAKRSAVRVYGETRLSPPQLCRLIGAAKPRPLTALQVSVLPYLRPVITGRTPGFSGTFVFSNGTLSPVAGGPAGRLHDSLDLIIQRSLSEAPVRIFFLARLHDALRQHGGGAHDELLRLAGQWVGELWLNLGSAGLAGCPAGACSEGEVLSSLPPEFRANSLLFTFVLGRPL